MDLRSVGVATLTGIVYIDLVAYGYATVLAGYEISRPLRAIYRHGCVVSTVSITSPSRVPSMKVRINSDRRGSRVGRSMHPAFLRISRRPGPFHLRLPSAFSRRPLKPQTRTAPVGRRRSVVSLPWKSESRNANSATLDGAAPYRKAVSGAATDRPISRLGISTICLLIALCRCVACCRYQTTSRMSPYPSVTPGPRSARIQIYQLLPDRPLHGVLCCVSENASSQLLLRPPDMSQGLVLLVSYFAKRPLFSETVQQRPGKRISMLGSSISPEKFPQTSHPLLP